MQSFFWVENEIDTLKSSEFTDKYGAVIEEIKLENYSIYYYPLFLYRRIAYAGLVVYVLDYPTMQLIVIFAVTVLPVCVVLIIDAYLLDMCETFY